MGLLREFQGVAADAPSGRKRIQGDAALVGIVDITDVCLALLDPDVSRPPADMSQLGSTG